MREDTPVEMFDGIWVKAAVPGTMFAVSVPLALKIETGLYLLWPIAYLGIALFYAIRRIGRPPRPHSWCARAIVESTEISQAAWFKSFEQRFPSPSGWRPLDVQELRLAGTGLRLLDYADVEIPVPMALGDYLRYMLSEVNVDSAIARGDDSVEKAREWCQRTLAAVFRGGEVTVVFRGYLATLAPTGGG